MQDNEGSSLREEIAQLNKRIASLEQMVREMQGVREAPKPEPAPPPPAPVPPAPDFEIRPAPSPPVAPKRADESELEAEIGGNWMNKIGAIALVLGIAFFLKYAFENRWIDETGRIIVGIIIGLACVYGGEYFHKKDFPKYAQGISGAGIAILYFAIYAAFSFYQLIPQLPAFAFMILVTITAIALAVRHDSIGIAILGIMGGFLTPALLNRPGGGGGDSEIQLFTYIAILDLGILGVTYYKNWRALNALSLAGTALVFAGWSLDNYGPEKLGVTMSFLTIFYAIFAAQSFVQNVVARRGMNPADLLLVVAAPVLYFSAGYSLLAGEYHIYLGMFATVLAAVYIAFAHKVHIVGFEDKSLRLLFLCIASGFLIAAVPIQLEKQWVTIGWAGEAVVIAGVGFYLNSVRTRYIGFGLLALSVIRLLTLESFQTFRPGLMLLLNERFLTFLFVIATALLMVWLYYRNREVMDKGERSLPVMLTLGANFLMIWALSWEALDWLSRRYATVPYNMPDGTDSLILSGVWAMYGVLMLIGGILRRYRPARLMGVVILGIVILKSFLYDVWILEKVYRIIAFLGLGALLLVASYLYQRYRDRVLRIVGGGDDNAG